MNEQSYFILMRSSHVGPMCELLMADFSVEAFHIVFVMNIPG